MKKEFLAGVLATGVVSGAGQMETSLEKHPVLEGSKQQEVIAQKPEKDFKYISLRKRQYFSREEKAQREKDQNELHNVRHQLHSLYQEEKMDDENMKDEQGKSAHPGEISQEQIETFRGEVIRTLEDVEKALEKESSHPVDRHAYEKMRDFVESRGILESSYAGSTYEVDSNEWYNAYKKSYEYLKGITQDEEKERVYLNEFFLKNYPLAVNVSQKFREIEEYIGEFQKMRPAFQAPKQLSDMREQVRNFSLEKLSESDSIHSILMDPEGYSRVSSEERKKLWDVYIKNADNVRTALAFYKKYPIEDAIEKIREGILQATLHDRVKSDLETIKTGDAIREYFAKSGKDFRREVNIVYTEDPETGGISLISLNVGIEGSVKVSYSVDKVLAKIPENHQLHMIHNHPTFLLNHTHSSEALDRDFSDELASFSSGDLITTSKWQKDFAGKKFIFEVVDVTQDLHGGLWICDTVLPEDIHRHIEEIEELSGSGWYNLISQDNVQGYVNHKAGRGIFMKFVPFENGKFNYAKTIHPS